MHGTLETTELQQTDQFTGPAAAWYALLVAPGLERKSCIWLRRRQYEPYWPRYKGPVKLNRHRQADRWRSVIPGYLFLPVECGRPPALRAMEDERWYRGALRNAERELIQIPEFGRQGMEQIRSIAEALNASPLAAADGVPFKVGQRIRLKKLDYIEACIVRLDKRRQICVEAPLFGQTVRITVLAEEIEAI